jgi:putative oxidoreductase
MRKLFYWMTSTDMNEARVSAGILFLRIAAGGFMLAFHGWGKLINFGDRWGKFGDPLGVGSELSLILTVFAEFFCSLALILGFKTRAAALPLLITMLVVATIVHADDPWNKKEFALLYAIPFLTLMFTGGGRYSLDAKWFSRK